MKSIQDIHSPSKAVAAFKTQALTTTTTIAGEIIDTAGFEALEFIFLTKTLTDGDYTITFYEGDAALMTDEAAVDSDEVLGGPISFADDTDDNAIARAGYIGKKRYVRAKISATGCTTGLDAISGVALLSNAHHQPYEDQNG